MPTLHRYEVLPSIPAALEPLLTIGHNLWWSWNEEAQRLFSAIDPALYERVAGNPLAVLAQAAQARLEELGRDPAYLDAIARVSAALSAYLSRSTWFDRAHGGTPLAASRIGYFSMEFGIHECLPVYSGGLGVLAGDHLKSASDLGVPVVGVGVAFSKGYFRQSLDPEGWQHERYPPNDWHDLPVTTVTHPNGEKVLVEVALPVVGSTPPRTRKVVVGAVRVDVGRVPLFLLDANLPENAPEDRELTNTLYGGDRNHRIRQEILLGVGGVRLLSAIGLSPTVCHLNEGHSAFLAIERVRQLMTEHGASFLVASEVAAAGNVFTTHTPVPAGNDAFAHDLIAPYLPVLGAGLGLDEAQTMRLGRVDPTQAQGGEFSMPVLAIRLADRYNGVSELHGREARAMWRVLWPGLAEHEVPIGSITNGVHFRTWVAPEVDEAYRRWLGEDWDERSADKSLWAKINDVPDAELWAMHERCRARLVAEIPVRMRALSERKGFPVDPRLGKELDPHALTIGFARRFATYKRGTLLLRDAERLHRILSQKDRPVQLLFAGKAHPQDWGGKELIRDIVKASRSEAFRGKILFVEDYDMRVARSLVAGCDVWLNTPRRPLEASGTSGMKACLNGALHASVLDGWWAEAYTGDNGFAIGHGEEYADPEYGDRVEAQALYRLLEDDIVPLFYERGEGGLPHGWIARMKRSLATNNPFFNTRRMVEEYTNNAYVSAARRVIELRDADLSLARQLAELRARMSALWPLVKIESVDSTGGPRVRAGEPITVTADIHLGAIAPGEVAVDVYYGRLRGEQAIGKGSSLALSYHGPLGEGRHRFAGTLPTPETGGFAFAVRVLPRHEAFPDRFSTRLLTWQ
ncbi:MAG: alpha-glucan family phosphorylase [Byssovorax sp.]